MNIQTKKPISRKNFLKSLGLAGGGTLLTLLSGQKIREAQASQPQNMNTSTSLEVNAAITMFGLDVSGLFNSYFDRCLIMGYETETIDVSLPAGVIQSYQPGRSRYLNLTLERGLTASMDVWEWMKVVKQNPNNSKYNVTLTAFDAEYRPVAQWNLTGCWPCEVSVNLGAEMRERVFLAAEFFQRVS